MKCNIEIALAPVRLERSFFPVIEFESSPEFGQQANPKRPKLNVEFDELQFAKDSNNPDRFRVTLGLQMQWPEETVPPYRKARILCVGDFRFADGTPEPLRERHMYMSAPSMLYSGAREFVKAITANGPYMTVMLPGATFAVVPIEEATPAEEPAGQ